MTGRSLRPLGGVLAAMALSLTGTRVSAIALPWFVLVTTGSAVQTGLVAFCEMTPYVLVKALIGPLVDRVGPRRISWVADVVSAAATGAVIALHAVDALAFGPLLGMVAVIGAARGPGDLAKEVMVPGAAERGRLPLERATGLAGVTERLAGTVGPAAGGALVALLGPLAGLGASAACFALGSVVVAWALPPGVGDQTSGAGQAPGVGDRTSGLGQVPGVGDRAQEERAGYWRRFGQGYRFLRGERLLTALIVMIGVTNLLDAALTSVLLPVWGRESGHGPAMIGVNSAVMGLAAIGGSLVAAAVAHRMRRRVVFFVAFLVGGAPRFLILAVDAPVWAMVAVFAVSGFGGGFLNPILAAVWYERVPRHLLGRVSALGDSVGYVGIPLGGLLAGAAFAWAGLAPVLVACGVAYFVTTNLTALRPEWREMDRLRGRGRPAVPEGAGTAG